MDRTAQLGQLLGLAEAVAGASSAEDVLRAALTPLQQIAGADAAIVVSATEPSSDGGGRQVTARAGQELGRESVVEVPSGSGLVDCLVPAGWREQGIGHVEALRLSGHLGILLLAWRQDDVTVGPELELALAHLTGALTRAASEENLADLAARVDNAQHLANMGDYDWHIPTDTNRWSDQLFRIYGHEPQSFNPSYERFLSLIHPDDRERIPACTSRPTPPASPTR